MVHTRSSICENVWIFINSPCLFTYNVYTHSWKFSYLHIGTWDISTNIYCMQACMDIHQLENLPTYRHMRYFYKYILYAGMYGYSPIRQSMIWLCTYIVSRPVEHVRRPNQHQFAEFVAQIPLCFLSSFHYLWKRS